MANQTLNLSPQIVEYIQSVFVKEAPILRELRQETATHPMGRMQIAPEQGQFMTFLLQLIGATKVLEIGVFTGYSSLAMALVLPDEGKLIACDVSDEYTQIARKYWEKAGVSHKIELNLAPALETLNKLIAQGEGHCFDFIFIDADKSNYDLYYEKSLELLRPGGLIAIDNVLWHGRVADSQIKDNRTKIIRALNKKIHQDQRVDISLVPIGDGLTLVRKKTRINND